jgi:hypothetical protein
MAANNGLQPITARIRRNVFRTRSRFRCLLVAAVF